jgi:monofunctional biosynthetic peptidoglycan transglycosylase
VASALLPVVALVIGGSALIVGPWRWIDPPTTAFIWRYESEAGRDAVQRWVPLRQVSPRLALAVIASEDQKFPDHRGFDLDSIASALREGDRGASTLTQQVAKNLYLWPGRSWSRKILEAWLTLWIELTWQKPRILEVYLNVAEFGPGIYGAAAASERFFGVSPRGLTEEQAAQLAAILPSPRRMSAAKPSAYVRARAREIREQMRQLGGVRFVKQL